MDTLQICQLGFCRVACVLVSQGCAHDHTSCCLLAFLWLFGCFLPFTHGSTHSCSQFILCTCPQGNPWVQEACLLRPVLLTNTLDYDIHRRLVGGHGGAHAPPAIDLCWWLLWAITTRHPSATVPGFCRWSPLATLPPLLLPLTSAGSRCSPPPPPPLPLACAGGHRLPPHHCCCRPQIVPAPPPPPPSLRRHQSPIVTSIFSDTIICRDI